MNRFFVLVIITFLLCNCIFLSPLEGSAISIPDNIRVVIADNAPFIELSIRGDYKLATIETGETLKEGKTFFNLKIEPTKNGLKFGNSLFKIYGLHVIPKNEPAIYLGKRLYRGSLQIIKTKEGTLRAINIIGLEDYLKGVLYHEVSNTWPIEAIKAQAIVSRTYALYQAQENKNNYYYLKSDVSSQVYAGVYAEKYRTNKAVDETRGQVLIYKGKLVPAFFHATCGGKTEDSSMLWKVKTPPLKGIRCNFCKNSPHFQWESVTGLDDIEERLKESKYKISGIKSIEITERDRSGRVSWLIIKSKAGRMKITGKDFRHIIGPRLIKSTNFNINIKNSTVYFKGKGWGHGVGMCQWGAFSMAKKRKTIEEILEFYYPGSQIMQLKD